MKILILAAGRGSRMGSHTDDRPKCLTAVRGASLLESALKACFTIVDKKDVVIIGGYKYEMLQKFHSQILVNGNWAETNIMGSLMVADEILRSEDCVVVYSDILFDVKDLFSVTRSYGATVLSVMGWRGLWESRFLDPLTDLEKFEFDPNSGRLIEIGGKARTIGEVQGQFGGIWKCTPSLWSLLSSSDKNLRHLDTTTALNWAISKNFEIRVIQGTGEWFEIDQVTDLDAT
jgi:choline kinase